MTGRLFLGIALDCAGDALFSADRAVELALIAERAGIDFVSLDDGFDPAPDRPDALLVMARVAPATTSIGLVATITTTHTEPFHVSKNVATLDLVSGGRTGWRVAVSFSAEAARRFGRKGVQSPDELYAEADDAIEVVSRLWDSWEDDAVIRDRPTGRYLDRAEGALHRLRRAVLQRARPFDHAAVTARSASSLHRRARTNRRARSASRRADIVLVDQPEPFSRTPRPSS